ncbi:hypothetical protein FOXYS1_12554, partial [Fusarium oxysporum]
MESLRNIAKLRRLQHNAIATTTGNLEVNDSTVQPSNSSTELTPDTQKAVSTDMNADEAPLIPNLTNFDGSNTAPLQRFIVLQDGHGHRIEQKLRKESLFDRWRKIMSKKQSQEDNKELILAAKYGRCQEVVGYGASGIVHVSRKKKDNGIGEEL